MKNPQRRVSDMDLVRLLGLPNTTSRDWKKRDDYRKKIYDLLKSFSYDELQERLEQIESVKPS